MNQPPKTKVYLEGRYRKLVRDLPQTVFYCPDCKGHPRRKRKCARCEGFGKLTRESVQELIAWPTCKLFGTRKNKFHGAGREDIDVRMLGSGRPFILELIAPKHFDVDLAELEAEINRRNEGRIEILGLHWSEKPRVAILKETPHAKEYEALVEVDGEVDPARLAEIAGQRYDVVQHTPTRVAHRRAKKDRERWVEFVSLEPDDARLRVRMKTQHGTYVKEVLSGEDGNTNPSLAALLGVPCRCIELDVVAILGEEGVPEEPVRAPSPFGAGL
ncbi:MAG TPA: tRNA pseudouridine(54/55) synthase Pus10 [Planctomycetes bacterium]|nr:tRNA pseudouridine(54/55) synthase Pus10 [Planctomycetota bacterium]